MEVPILVRSLADSLAILDEDELSIAMSPDFLLTLDCDLSIPKSNCRIVDSYECDWWNARKPRDLNSAMILDRLTIEKCLEKHLIQLNELGLGPEMNARPTTPVLPPHPGASSTHLNLKESSAAKSLQCQKCDQYSQILSNTLQDILDAHNFANTMLTSSEAQWNLGMRRASTFNLLHEAAVIKEKAEPSSARSAFSKNDQIKSVAENAKRELKRLQALPPTSYKWTWGEQLTEGEVIDLARSGTRPKHRFHSGYDLSHNQGNFTGNNSPFPSMPKSIDDHHDPPTDSPSSLPEYGFPGLPYFEKKQNMLYDPLGKTNVVVNSPADIQASTSEGFPRLAELTTKNVNLHTEMSLLDDVEHVKLADIANEWQSASDDIPKAQAERTSVRNDTSARNIANEWSSASGEIEKSHEIGKSAGDVVGDIADYWESGNEYIAEPHQSPEHHQIDISPGMHIEDMWSSVSDEEVVDSHTPGRDENLADGVENFWESDSKEEPAAELNNLSPLAGDTGDGHPIVGIEDEWSSASEEVLEDTSAHRQFRRFGPEDFQNLKDHMFEEKQSDSESENEYE